MALVGAVVLYVGDAWWDAGRPDYEQSFDLFLRQRGLVEACREFVASEGGLPESLEELARHHRRTDHAPLPLTSRSGQPFRLERRADGRAVRVWAPTDDGAGDSDASAEPEWVVIPSPAGAIDPRR